MKNPANQLRARRSFPALALLGVLCAWTFELAAQKKAETILSADKGKFSISQDGKIVGHEEFEISPGGEGWVVKGTTELKTAGAEFAMRVTGNLALQADGTPTRYDWTSQGDKNSGARLVFANGIAKITLEMQGARPFDQELSFSSPRIAVLDDNLYHQYAVLARLYDWSKRGSQSISVIIPQELTPGFVTMEATGSTSADGKSYEGFKVSTTDLEVDLLLDANHRLMRLEVPSAKVSVVRQ